MNKKILISTALLLLLGVGVISPLSARSRRPRRTPDEGYLKSTLKEPDRRHAIRLGLAPGTGSVKPATLEEDRYKDKISFLQGSYINIPLSEEKSIGYLNNSFFWQYRYMDRLRIGVESTAVVNSWSDNFDTYRYSPFSAGINLYGFVSNRITDYSRFQTRQAVDYFHPITSNWMIGAGIGHETFSEIVENEEQIFLNQGNQRREYNYSGFSLMLGTEYRPWRWLRISYYLQMPDLRGNYLNERDVTSIDFFYLSSSFIYYYSNFSGDTAMKGLRHNLDVEFRLARGYRMHVGLRSESFERTYSLVTGYGFNSTGFVDVDYDPILMSGKYKHKDRQIYMKYDFPIEFGRNTIATDEGPVAPVEDTPEV